VLNKNMVKHKIWLYRDIDSNSPVKNFIDKSNGNQKSKILKHLLYLSEFGVTKQNPYLKKITGTQLWESRILGKDNIRIICVNSKYGIAILHIFLKKRQKTHNSDIQLATKRLKSLI
jgi:phage-related protein